MALVTTEISKLGPVVILRTTTFTLMFLVVVGFDGNMPTRYVFVEIDGLGRHLTTGTENVRMKVDGIAFGTCESGVSGFG